MYGHYSIRERQKTEWSTIQSIMGEQYGHTADIYFLGMVMYWLLNNQTLPRRDEKLQPPAIGSEKLKEIVMVFARAVQKIDMHQRRSYMMHECLKK